MQEWKDIPGIVEISGFRATLHSEGALSNRFRTLFDQFLTSVKNYRTPAELRVAFIEGTTLQHKQNELQVCFDEIIATNMNRRRNQ